MTYFLDGPDEPPIIPVDQSTGGVPSLWQGIKAGVSTAQIQSDSNFLLSRSMTQVANERLAVAVDRLGEDRLSSVLKENGISTRGMTASEYLKNAYAEPRAKILATEMARDEAAANPDQWADLDLSEEGITSEVNGRLRAEYEEAQQILDMMPSGRAAAEFVGGIAGLTADIRNLPFLIVGGGGGSFLKTMGREAFLNMAAETVTLPSQFEMAERLDIPDPNIRTQLAMAAVGGAVFGGVFEGAARGIEYWKGRSRPVELPGYDRTGAQRAVDAAEDALVSESPRPVDAAVRASEGVEPAPLPAIPDDLPGRVPFDPDPNRPDFVNTRGQGTRFHGSPRPVEELSEGAYSSLNYYGQGFYTTDAVAIADGYKRKSADGKIYTVEETQPITAFDMEQEVPEFLRTYIAEQPEYSGLGNLAKDAMSENPSTVRDLYDAIRDISRAESTPADEVQELFEDFADQFRGQGFGALDHKGGLRTNKAEHAVRIYLDPSEQIRLSEVDPESLKPRPQAPSAPARTTAAPDQASASQMVPETQRDFFDDPGSDKAKVLHDDVRADIQDQIDAENDFLVDMGDGKGERPVSKVLAEIEKGEEFAEALKLCGAPRVAE